MTDPHGCVFAHDDAAYVLGALSPEEAHAFERHLAGCSRCATSVREVSDLPGLLALAPPDVLDVAEAEPAPVPPAVLPQLLRDVRRARQRRRWSVVLAAAAALVLIGAGVGLGVVVAGDDGEAPSPAAEPSTASPRDMNQVDQDEVTAEISLTPVGWGTRLDLTCGYEQRGSGYGGSGEGRTYALLVRSVDGDVQQVATWRGLPGTTMHLTGATALTTEEISSVEVRTAEGRQVLEMSG